MLLLYASCFTAVKATTFYSFFFLFFPLPPLTWLNSVEVKTTLQNCLNTGIFLNDSNSCKAIRLGVGIIFTQSGGRLFRLTLGRDQTSSRRDLAWRWLYNSILCLRSPNTRNPETKVYYYLFFLLSCANSCVQWRAGLCPYMAASFPLWEKPRKVGTHFWRVKKKLGLNEMHRCLRVRWEFFIFKCWRLEVSSLWKWCSNCLKASPGSCSQRMFSGWGGKRWETVFVRIDGCFLMAWLSFKWRLRSNSTGKYR